MLFLTRSEISVVDRYTHADFRIKDKQNIGHVATKVFYLACLLLHVFVWSKIGCRKLFFRAFD